MATLHGFFVRLHLTPTRLLEPHNGHFGLQRASAPDSLWARATSLVHGTTCNAGADPAAPTLPEIMVDLQYGRD